MRYSNRKEIKKQKKKIKKKNTNFIKINNYYDQREINLNLKINIYRRTFNDRFNNEYK